eukprot:GHVU01182866.1.p1 GENE.GHVU01182866.1~~GHVU01182866.1.p1  ORF type:complete len:232 (-),score=45.45 GHVU01182866.1:420-1046(-)
MASGKAAPGGAKAKAKPKMSKKKRATLAEKERLQKLEEQRVAEEAESALRDQEQRDQRKRAAQRRRDAEAALRVRVAEERRQLVAPWDRKSARAFAALDRLRAEERAALAYVDRPTVPQATNEPELTALLRGLDDYCCSRPGAAPAPTRRSASPTISSAALDALLEYIVCLGGRVAQSSSREQRGMDEAGSQREELWGQDDENRIRTR